MFLTLFSRVGSGFLGSIFCWFCKNGVFLVDFRRFRVGRGRGGRFGVGLGSIWSRFWIDFGWSGENFEKCRFLVKSGPHCF